MFGFPDNVIKKIRMLHYLDEQASYTQSSLIAEQLDIQNQTVLKYCREINENLKQLTIDGEMIIDTSTRYGIRLIRTKVNFDPIVGVLLQKELPYAIFKQLIQSRDFLAETFCKENQVSLSKLRRTVARMNDFIHQFNLHISVSHMVKITGEEERIRTLFFLFACYLPINQLDMIPKESKLESQRSAWLIVEELKLEPNNLTIELLAIWYFINQFAIEYDFELSYTKQEVHCPPPLKLKSWNERNWYFFVCILVSFEIISLPELSLGLSETGSIWIRIFEKYFRPLTPYEKNSIHQQFNQMEGVRKLHFFQPDVYEILQPWRLERQLKNTPFEERFEAFWTEFHRVSSQKDELVHKKSFLLCYNFTSIEQTLPNIQLFIYSSLPETHRQFIQLKIQQRFLGRFNLEFVKESIEADLVIMTEYMNRENVDLNQTVVMVNAILSMTDLKELEQVMKTILSTNPL